MFEVSQQISLNSVPAAILWHEGMLLRPEHFEQLTARQELLLQHQAASTAFAWGVSVLEIDQAALSRGRLALLEFEGRLPDGLALKAGSEERGGSAEPSIDLSTVDSQRPVLVYVAMLALDPKQPTLPELRAVAVAEADEALRTGRQSEDFDEEDEEQAPIPRLRPRFHLLASPDGISSKYAGMPIARLEFRNGVWTMDESFLPPVERVRSDSTLTRQCSATLRRVRELAVFLLNRYRSATAEERSETSHEIVSARSLAAALPMTEAMTASGAVHPFSLYLAFCGLAGHVASLSADPLPPSFPPYNHDDLGQSFAELNSYINKVLTEGDTREFLGIPFTFQKNVFSLPFAAEWAGSRLILAIRASSSREPGAIAWTESALIGARSLQQGMRERRVLGAGRERLAAEKGLFVGSGVILYHLQESPDYLKVGEPLDLATGPSALASDIPMEVTLYVRQTNS